MNARDGQSRVMSSDSGICLSTSGGMVVGGHSRMMSKPSANYPVRGSGSQLIGGGATSTYPVAGTSTALTGDPAHVPSVMNRAPVKLGPGGRVDGGQSVWNPRASMAFDSAKGLLNPVGENNCFLNSAVQVRRVSLCLATEPPTLL